jgi:hypothetical protein
MPPPVACRGPDGFMLRLVLAQRTDAAARAVVAFAGDFPRLGVATVPHRAHTSIDDGRGGSEYGASSRSTRSQVSARISSVRAPVGSETTMYSRVLRRRNVSAELLGQRNDDALGAADVAEPIAVLVLVQLADEFGAIGVQAGKDVLDC